MVGNSLGIIRYWLLVAAIQKSAFTTSRKSVVRGRLINPGKVRNGSINSHSSFVTSLAYRLLLRAHFPRVVSVHILYLHRCLDTAMELQVTGSTQTYFSQTLRTSAGGSGEGLPLRGGDPSR